MLIRVEHSTAYSYSEPLLSSTQYLRMTPLSGRTQTVESWKLSCPGALTTRPQSFSFSFVSSAPLLERA